MTWVSGSDYHADFHVPRGQSELIREDPWKVHTTLRHVEGIFAPDSDLHPAMPKSRASVGVRSSAPGLALHGAGHQCYPDSHHLVTMHEIRS